MPLKAPKTLYVADRGKKNVHFEIWMMIELGGNNNNRKKRVSEIACELLRGRGGLERCDGER